MIGENNKFSKDKIGSFFIVVDNRKFRDYRAGDILQYDEIFIESVFKDIIIFRLVYSSSVKQFKYHYSSYASLSIQDNYDAVELVSNSFVSLMIGRKNYSRIITDRI